MINKTFTKRYCCEDISLIENYDKAVNDTTQTWQIHHKLEIELNKKRDELIKMGLYYHRPASELIFLTIGDHRRVHHPITNYAKRTDEWRQMISDLHTGIPKSDTQKMKMSEKRRIYWQTHTKTWSNGSTGKHRVYDNPEHTRWHME